MQYNIDMHGKFANIFKKIRAILLSYPQIKEIKNAKQTSYSDKYGVIVMMRTKGDAFVVAFGKGAKLQEKYPWLQGNGKIVRHLYFKSLDDVDEALLREMIEESFISVNLKCDPIYALELRSLYEGIIAGYHMNKKHWNTVTVEDSDVDDEMVKELIDHSYELVYNSLTKKLRHSLS